MNELYCDLNNLKLTFFLLSIRAGWSSFTCSRSQALTWKRSSSIVSSNVWSRKDLSWAGNCAAWSQTPQVCLRWYWTVSCYIYLSHLDHIRTRCALLRRLNVLSVDCAYLRRRGAFAHTWILLISKSIVPKCLPHDTKQLLLTNFFLFFRHWNLNS